MQTDIEKRMEQIQQVFLDVQNVMQKNHSLEEVLSFLDTLHPEYRSVAYESASMEIGMKEILNGLPLQEWMIFYRMASETHSFHLEIGLGWAFAKTELSPLPYMEKFSPMMQWMVADGIGYYNGLFKGRKTIKYHQVPEVLSGELLRGFDQGLGRRLWYNVKGNVDMLSSTIKSFPENRQGDLWRGVGIASAYVGGCDSQRLESLKNQTAEFIQQFCSGITLAAMSRLQSNTVTQDIELACAQLCGRPLPAILEAKTDLRAKIDTHSESEFQNWMTEVEEMFVK
jgi:enediyne biosynthesis protein E3